MNVGAVLGRQVGPLPLGVWLLAGAGGLYLSRHVGRSGSSASADSTPTDLTSSSGDVIDPSPDNAPIQLSPVFYVPGGQPAGSSGPAPITPPPPPASAPGHRQAHPAPVHHVAPHARQQRRPRSVIVRPGDTLSGIGARIGAPWQAIYQRNRQVIESTARRHGLPDSGGGHWIFPGTRLVIP